MTTHEVLVEARNLLTREGWRNDSHFAGPGGSGPYCMVGAVIYAGSIGWEGPCRELSKAIGLNTATPMIWNDRPERTKEEVLAAFDKAIAATAPEPDTSFLPKPLRDPVPA